MDKQHNLKNKAFTVKDINQQHLVYNGGARCD